MTARLAEALGRVRQGGAKAFVPYAPAGLDGVDADLLLGFQEAGAEAVEVLPRLLRGEAVTFDGEHYHLKDARSLRTYQDHVPLLVGVNGRSALAHAAKHADIYFGVFEIGG